jgi:hypothetical protein
MHFGATVGVGAGYQVNINFQSILLGRGLNWIEGSLDSCFEFYGEHTGAIGFKITRPLFGAGDS